jgi:hypothetical protein
VKPSWTLLHAYISSCLQECAEGRPCSRVCSTGPGCAPSPAEYQCKPFMSTWRYGIQCRTYNSITNQTKLFDVGQMMGPTRQNRLTPCCTRHRLRSDITNSSGRLGRRCGSRSFFGWPSGVVTGPVTGELGMGYK